MRGNRGKVGAGRGAEYGKGIYFNENVVGHTIYI